MTSVLSRPSPVAADPTRRWHRPLLVMVAAMAVLVVVSSLGLVLDERRLLDASVWAKPLKFGVSFVLYGLTLAWMLPRLTRFRRTGWWLGTVFAVTGVVDVGFVAVQAARGTYSHFNAGADAFNQVGQQVFATGVVGLFGVSLVIAVLLVLQRVGGPATTWALRAGLLVSVAGMVVAFGIAGTGVERELLDAYGRPVPMGGAHGVGVPDGSGMPVTGWSAVGGDLRVPHFVGIHALQVFLLTDLAVGVLATRLPRLRGERVRAQLVGVVIGGWTGLFALTTWQALGGESVLHPGTTTRGLAAVLLTLTLVGAGTVLAGTRSREARG